MRSLLFSRPLVPRRCFQIHDGGAHGCALRRPTGAGREQGRRGHHVHHRRAERRSMRLVSSGVEDDIGTRSSTAATATTKFVYAAAGEVYAVDGTVAAPRHSVNPRWSPSVVPWPAATKTTCSSLPLPAQPEVELDEFISLWVPLSPAFFSVS